MFKKLLFLLVSLSISANAQQLNNLNPSLNKMDKSFFIQNKGQWDPEVKYLALIAGMNAWITNSGVVYDYYKINKNYEKSKTLKMNSFQKMDFENKNTTIQGHVVKMQLVNFESNITGVGNNPREGYYNYFIGNDQSKWTSYVPLYDNVELQGVYKNIDVKYYYDNGILRYDYKAKPGADISMIKFKFDGQDGLRINSNGEIVLNTSIGDITNGKIFAYQMEGENQKEVECKFEQKEDGSIGLRAENYDATKELIIDPLVYSTFIGGSNQDGGSSIAVDAIGDAYITGWTFSPNFPVTNGAYQDTMYEIQDVFITKLNSTGSSLIYSTFIGGRGGNSGTSIEVDSIGDTYITGATNSPEYPSTGSAYQKTLKGTQNAFITKINSTGSALIYSTYIGGDSYDTGNSIVFDSQGNAYITGQTGSTNYPTTSSAFQTKYGGGGTPYYYADGYEYYGDAFITKLNAAGSNLVYSTFIGGDSTDAGNSIDIDANGNAYITGSTSSHNFPITIGAFQSKLGDSASENAFVTKINSSGSALIYSTFIGGNYRDEGTAIKVDLDGDAYITGEALSSNYPSTNGAYQTTRNGIQNVVVTKLNSTGSALKYSTFIGGSGFAGGFSIALDAIGNAYITGTVIYSSDYPVTNGAYQSIMADTSSADIFVTKLDSTGSALIYSTLIGGNDWDVGNSIVIDAGENVYITGFTQSSNYPATNGVYQTTLNGTRNAYVTKLNLSSTTFVQSKSSVVPNKFELYQNYPNPFNPSTIINYALPFSSNVKIEVYNILGERVRELLNGQKSAGYYSINLNTAGLSSGVYLYMIQAKSLDGKSEYINTKKMILLK
jgi:hypothetical protein